MFILDECWPEILLSEKKKVVLVDVWEGAHIWFECAEDTAASLAVVIRDARSALWRCLFWPLGGAAWFAGSWRAVPGGTFPWSFTFMSRIHGVKSSQTAFLQGEERLWMWLDESSDYLLLAICASSAWLLVELKASQWTWVTSPVGLVTKLLSNWALGREGWAKAFCVLVLFFALKIPTFVKSH